MLSRAQCLRRLRGCHSRGRLLGQSQYMGDKVFGVLSEATHEWHLCQCLHFLGPANDDAGQFEFGL